MLKKSVEGLSNGDETNREGHAAKVYFNALFGNIGRRVPNFYNFALNYEDEKCLVIDNDLCEFYE